jgi:hypothetical protein
MSEATAVPPEKPEPSILVHLRNLMKVRARIGCVLFADASLFAFWILTAWVIDGVASFAKAHEVHDFCADLFKWFSSGSTFLLVSMYIVADIRDAARDAFKSESKK